MKIIRPQDFKGRAEKGELYLRVDFNVVNLSTQLIIDMGLKAGDRIYFAEDNLNDTPPTVSHEAGDRIYFAENKELFMLKCSNQREDGFSLRRLGDKTLCFSMKSFCIWLLRRYGLDELMRNSTEFKHHKFPMVPTDIDGITMYRIVPPVKYVAPKKEEKASSNGVLQKFR